MFRVGLRRDVTEILGALGLPPRGTKVKKRINGQASRLISIGKLHTLRHVHTRPIDLVIFQEPLGIL